MRKILVGAVAAVILLGSGAYFGWELWAQFRTRSEVERVFDSLRTAFGTASHGRIELYPRTRSLKISNIVLQSQDRATTIKIGQIVAVGTRGPVAGRVAAARIEITNWEITSEIAIATAPAVTYRAPSVVIEAFSGPATMPVSVDSASMIEAVRAAMEYAAASTANTIKIPRLVANIAPRKSEPPAPAIAPVEYTYSDILFQNIRNRRIAAISVERTTITSEGVSPELGSFAGAMGRMSLAELDLGVMAALFDPNKPKEDAYRTVYRQASMGPFEVRFAQGARILMEGITVDEIGVRSSKFSIANMLALAESAPRAGTPPTPAQLSAMIDQLANMYEGIRIGKFEMRGLAAQMPPNVNFNLGAVRISGFENGRLAEFALEGLDGKSPTNEPVSVGRFAFKGLQIANLIRQTARLAETNPAEMPDRLAGLLALLESIEVDDLSVTPRLTRQPVRIETFRISWGQFVGPVPSTIRFTAKTTVPADLADMGVGGVLSDAGLATITTRVDIGVAWNEATQTLAITPALFEVENGFSFSADVAIRNVPRSMFSTNPAVAAMAVDEFEAGPIKISLRDTGAVRTALAQYAKTKSLSVEDARKEIIESIRTAVKSPGQSTQDAEALAAALVQFIQAPGSTLTISVNPKERVKFKQLFEKSADPAAITSQFAIEVKTTQ
jgi:hypothetical protein